MSAATADIRTEWGSRYLGQLCAHFSHNKELAVTLRETSGVIRFPSGDCVLNATADTLHLALECRDQAALERLQEVIDKHLKRFAFREPPEIEWHPA
jgi:uncharacterized protein